MKEQLEKYKKLFSLMLEDLRTKGKRHKQIPNILTMLRLVAPFIIIPSFITGNIPLALGCVVASKLTDALDGFIARKFELTSELGKDLDAVADKVLSVPLMILLVTANPVYLISLVLEGITGAVCSYKKLHNIDIRTCKVGKVKTIILDIFIILGFASILTDLSPLLLNIMCATTGVLQVAAIAEYIKVDKKIEEPEIEQEYENPTLMDDNEIEDDEIVYEKTLTYPKGYYVEKDQEKKLVKTIKRN